MTLNPPKTAIPFDRAISVRTFLRPVAQFLTEPAVTELAIVRPGELFTRERGAWHPQECSTLKAEHYAARAESVGKGGISSDDPEAIAKLKRQLEGLTKSQETMKKANAVIRQRRGDEDAQIEGILAIGCFTNDQARDIVRPDFAGRVGFASYALTNNNANIRRIQARIKQLETAQEREAVSIEGNGYTYSEDPDDNRAAFVFDGKPERETRDVLKRHGFRWSPTRGAWVRQLNNAAIWHARELMRILAEQDA